MLVYLGSLHTYAHDKIHFLFLAAEIKVEFFLFFNSVATTRATLVCKHPYIPHPDMHFPISYTRLQSLRAVACLDFKTTQ